MFNAAANFIDRHIAEGREAKIAIDGVGRRLSYRELFEQVNRVGNALRTARSNTSSSSIRPSRPAS